MNDLLYNKPRYYHLAFPDIFAFERKMIETCFSRHVSFPIKRVLEAACGTGRLLVDLPKRGYHVTAYDLIPEMVTYSTQRVAEAGLQDWITVRQGDMATITFDEKFDAALNLFNSIGYLHKDEAILSHLNNTGDAIKSGGILLLSFDCSPRADDEKGSHSWQIEESGVRGTVTWGLAGVDRQTKLSYQYFEMDADDNGTRVSFRDDHTLRLWLYNDFKKLVNKSGRFELEAIYNESGEPVSLDADITGALGNLFYVLKRI